MCSYGIARVLSILYQNYLKKAGYKREFDDRMQHELTQNILLGRIFIWEDLKTLVTTKSLPSLGKMINSLFYYQQLIKLQQAIEKNSKQKGRRFTRWQCQTTHIFSYPKTTERTCIRNLNAFWLYQTIVSFGLCNIPLMFII